jgi:hypothetical protein
MGIQFEIQVHQFYSKKLKNHINSHTKHLKKATKMQTIQNTHLFIKFD